MNIINFTMPSVSGFEGFLVNIIIWLVEISSSIALGIVLFTLILKLITLPFDYFSRASMRKNSLKMEEMRPELEKLQKQYADNKELYSQKMMALYKKNGYSMFGSCLPTILTLVIFFIAIGAFTDYSQYQNKKGFYEMSQSYNSVVYAGFDYDEQNGDYIYADENGVIQLKGENIIKAFEGEEAVEAVKTLGKNLEVKQTKIFVTEGENTVQNGVKYEIYTSNGYSKVTIQYNKELTSHGAKEFSLSPAVLENLKAGNLASENNNFLKNEEGLTFAEAYAQVKDTENAPTEDAYALVFIDNIQSYEAAQKYRELEETEYKFFWIKNIWVADSAFKQPVEKSWGSFKSTHEYSGNDIGDAGYNKLIACLGDKTSEPNGYFILVVLTALTSLLTQIVMGKSQKASMELQTVDGQGAQTQKMMQWMMPLMMAFFAFMYTSAFSIYIILSSLMSMLTTLGINFIVDRQVKKEREKRGMDEIRGRVYTPKPEEKKPEKKEKKKADEDDTGSTFLSGKADNKKGNIRGRIK